MSLDKTSTSFITEKITSNYNELVGQLSIFADLQPASKKDSEDDNLNIERPITPIDKEILEAPKTREDFMQLLHRRIVFVPEHVLSHKSQLILLGIVDQELGLLWPDLIGIVDYPLFNDSQNLELRRCLFILVIMRSQEIFKKYCEKMILYKNKDIYSDEANITRLKLQLAMDLRGRLHIPTLRRHLYQHHPDTVVKETVCCPYTQLEKAEDKYHHNVMDKKRIYKTDDYNSGNVALSLEERALVTNKISRTMEMPEMNTLQNEDIDSNYQELTSDRLLEAIRHTDNFENKIDLLELHANGENLADIDKESEESQNEISNEQQTIFNIEKGQIRLQEKQDKIKLLIQKNDNTNKKEHYEIQKPLIPQPCTIPRSFNGQIYLVPDIRPTPRKSDINITLKSYGPLWNELADEIDAETVKQLDRNLHRSEEIKEVYKEMMKTVSHEHLSYTQDPIFEACPQKVHIQDFVSSHTLVNVIKNDRIINDRLKRCQDSPWAIEKITRTEWEKPNYKIIESTEIDLKSYVDMSKSVAEKQLGRRSHIGSSLSGGGGYEPSKDYGSLGGGGTSVTSGLHHYVSKESMAPIRNIFPKRSYLISPEQFVKGLNKLPRLMQDRLKKLYEEWYDLWKEDLNSDDYKRFLSVQPTDFLSVIFHHFDAEGEDAAEEDDVDPKVLEQLHQKKVRDMERLNLVNTRVEELEQEKSSFSKGSWNPSTIMLGGLGKPPILTDENLDTLLKDKPSLKDPESRSSKKTVYSRGKSAVSEGKPTPLFVFQKSIDEDPIQKSLQVTLQIHSSKMLSKNDRDMYLIQQRLESVWQQLKMPRHLRVDMAIKFSSKKSIVNIDPLLRQWERATEAVLKREKVLLELEKFEQVYSDPNRFFAKGHMGSSAARMEESEARKEIYEKLDTCSNVVHEVMRDFKVICDDELTYGGRPYLEKMKWDRVQMLYWLQEQRKINPANNSSSSTNLPNILL